jgi:hypothetical protein
MKKICLVITGLCLSIIGAFAQVSDSSAYKSRKLVVEEVNLVSSYYHQDGNNSAVEGGIGSEKLTDFANILEVKMYHYDKKNRKHSWALEAGIDYYTSASSDRIDTKANSSASSSDIRFYPMVSCNMENEVKGTNIGLHASFSTEFDYQSIGFGASFGKKSKDRNRELTLRAQAYLDQVSIILPIELRGFGGGGEDEGYPREARNSYSFSASVSQVINERLQLMLITELVKQDGFLALPFHRVIFNDNSPARSEKLPSSRFKVPIGLRANYFMGDHLVLRSFYRYYQDDWGLNSHTADIEAAYKFSSFVSLTPFYRYYKQTAIDYFAPYQQHKPTDEFYTSNYDLSAFTSHFYGAGIRLGAPRGVLGIKKWNMVEIRYGRYNRSTNLNANIISMHLKFK